MSCFMRENKLTFEQLLPKLNQVNKNTLEKVVDIKGMQYTVIIINYQIMRVTHVAMFSI